MAGAPVREFLQETCYVVSSLPFDAGYAKRAPQKGTLSEDIVLRSPVKLDLTRVESDRHVDSVSKHVSVEAGTAGTDEVLIGSRLADASVGTERQGNMSRRLRVLRRHWSEQLSTAKPTPLTLWLQSLMTCLIFRS